MAGRSKTKLEKVAIVSAPRRTKQKLVRHKPHNPGVHATRKTIPRPSLVLSDVAPAVAEDGASRYSLAVVTTVTSQTGFSLQNVPHDPLAGVQVASTESEVTCLVLTGIAAWLIGTLPLSSRLTTATDGGFDTL